MVAPSIQAWLKPKSNGNGNRLAAAPGDSHAAQIKSASSRSWSLVGRAERVAGRGVSRSQGALRWRAEVPIDVLGGWQGAKGGER